MRRKRAEHRDNSFEQIGLHRPARRAVLLQRPHAAASGRRTLHQQQSGNRLRLSERHCPDDAHGPRPEPTSCNTFQRPTIPTARFPLRPSTKPCATTRAPTASMPIRASACSPPTTFSTTGRRTIPTRSRKAARTSPASTRSTPDARNCSIWASPRRSARPPRTNSTSATCAMPLTSANQSEESASAWPRKASKWARELPASCRCRRKPKASKVSASIATQSAPIPTS